MQDGVKPGVIMLIGGGAVVFIASLLDWIDAPFGSKTEWFGITWLFTLLIGGGIAVAVGLSAFTNVTLPESILGFTLNQLWVSLSFSAFLILFGLFIGGEERGIGLLLGFLGAGVMVTGGFMEMQSEASGGGGAAPTQF